MEKKQKIIHPVIFQRDLGLFGLSGIICLLISLILSLADLEPEIATSVLTLPLLSIIIYLWTIYRKGYEGSQIKSLLVMLFIFGLINGYVFYEVILCPEQYNFQIREFDFNMYIISTIIGSLVLHIFRILPRAIKNSRY